jgi:hypothetical protein
LSRLHAAGIPLPKELAQLFPDRRGSASSAW